MQFSLSEPMIENEALTVAAVDPGAYRSFTPPKYANFQDAWDRVAGGELALKERLKDKLTDRRRTATCGSVAPPTPRRCTSAPTSSSSR